jgi:aspartyl-tRNA(Asn)/glutamyl-tRNA(Gln) amidotransferase subunit A
VTAAIDAKTIAWMSAFEIAERVSRREVKAIDVVEAQLARTKAVEPRLNAYINILEDDARAQARAVDERVLRGEKLPLAGVPIAIKDNLCMKGVLTTAASKILANFRAPYDAHVIEKLRAAGAVAIGKANLDEFAMGSSTENSAYGPSRNPWDTTRVPGGSSGGSAAAVAGGAATIALGSDTGGSIRQPAALCGIVGHKPTYGLVSRYGLIAFASSLDQIGPLARDCRDAALLLEAIQGHDPRDATSANKPATAFADAKGTGRPLQGMTFGLPREYVDATTDPETKAALEASVKRLEALGAKVKEVRLKLAEAAIATYYLVATAEASSNLARYDGVHYGHRTEGATTLEALYSRSRSEGFGKEVQRRILLGTFVLSAGFYDAYYMKAQRCRSLIKDDLVAALEGCDAIVGPTSPVPAFKIGEKASDPLTMYACDIFTLSVNLSGFPGISIPCGFTRAGLPIGLQLVARPWEDGKLLGIGRSFELADKTPARRPVL